MSFESEYVFPFTLTKELKQEIQSKTQQRLTEMLGVEVDTVMAEYVVVMVGNKKSMGQIAHDLVDFIGDEHSKAFAQWLSQELPSLEPQEQEEDLAPPKPNSPAKKVISLKGKSNTSTNSSTTVRTLNRSGEDLRDVLARRSQRFGTEQVEKSGRNNDRGNKRKAEGQETKSRPGSGRLSQLLGPPVNEDQAELDARDSFHSNKRKKGDGKDKDRRGQNTNGNNRRRQEDRSHDRSRDIHPPLPPNSPPPDNQERSKDKDGARHGDGRGPIQHHGYHGGPPPGYGGYGPPPFGPPMYYPPPYGHMPPYGMGFPPHQHHSNAPRGPMMGPKSHFQHPPRGAPRAIPFQNRKWVNPNTVKPEDPAIANSDGTEGSGESTSETTTYRPGSAKPYIPRNPYYSQVPRFQNKTWVRPDTVADDALDKSLPKTPPPEATE